MARMRFVKPGELPIKNGTLKMRKKKNLNKYLMIVWAIQLLLTILYVCVRI